MNGTAVTSLTTGQEDPGEVTVAAVPGGERR